MRERGREEKEGGGREGRRGRKGERGKRVSVWCVCVCKKRDKITTSFSTVHWKYIST